MDSETGISDRPLQAALIRKEEAVVLSLILILIIFSQSLFFFYTHRGWKVLDITVSAIAVDRQRTFFAAGMDGTLYRADGAHLVPYSTESVKVPLAAGETVTALMIDAQDRIWIGTSNGFIARLGSDRKWVKIAPENPGKDQGVSELLRDGRGVVWVRGKTGLGKISPGTNPITYAYDNPGLDNIAIDIALDSKDRLWAIDNVARLEANGELVILGDNTVKVYNPDGTWKIRAEGLHLLRLAIDDQDRPWVGKGYPDGDEVSVWNGEAWVRYSFDDNPHLGGSVTALTLDSQGRVWLASLGLHRLEPDGSWRNYVRRNSPIPHVAIQDITIDANGHVWLRAYRGLLVVLDSESSFPPLEGRTLSWLSVISLLVILVVALGFTRLPSGRMESAVRSKTIIAFSVGLLGWFAVHSLFWLVVSNFIAPLGGPGAGAFFMICGFVPLVPNLVVFYKLFRRRKVLALGLPAAFIVNLTGHFLVTPGGFELDALLTILGMIPYF